VIMGGKFRGFRGVSRGRKGTEAAARRSWFNPFPQEKG